MQKFFDGESYAVRVVRAVEESHHLADKLVRLYNWMLRNRQHWMKYYYWFINRIRPDTREFFHKRCIGYVQGAVRTLVSAHRRQRSSVDAAYLWARVERTESR